MFNNWSQEYNKGFNKQSGFLQFSDTQDTHYDDQEYYHQNSGLDNRTYLTDIKPAQYHKAEYELVPKIPNNDPNDPANLPFTPADQYEDDYQEYVVRYIRNLSKYTRNQEEIAFVKYICECSLIDLRVEHLQQLLKNDPRFNAKQLFDFFDCKKNKFLDFNEFQLGLQKLNIVLDSTDAYALFLRYGGDNDGQISSAEFKYILIGPDDSSQFMQFGAMKYMHHPMRQAQDQFLSVAQRDTIAMIMEQQTHLERNLHFIREIIGERDILLALFRQIDIGSKGYITISDLILYLNDLGGQFMQKDVNVSFRRMSKMNCSRINFNEFRKEFEDRGLNEFQQKRIRQQDYLEELHKQKNTVPVQIQATSTEPKKSATNNLVQPKQPYVQQAPIIKKERQSIDEDMDDLLFPGFQKYELKAPIQ